MRSSANYTGNAFCIGVARFFLKLARRSLEHGLTCQFDRERSLKLDAVLEAEHLLEQL